MLENSADVAAGDGGFCRKLKVLYFLLVHRLLHQCRVTQPTVAVALLIECMQLAQFSISRQHPLFSPLTISGLFESGTTVVTQ